jgi:N-acetylmuramoyl-L-alanine amidase
MHLDQRSTAPAVGRERYAGLFLDSIGVYLRSSAAKYSAPELGFRITFAASVMLGLVQTAIAANVAIDVGHYLARPGAMSARGVPEFEYNLQLALETAAALRRAGHRIILIGDDGMADDLARRSRRASGMDLFISIHHDSVQPRFLAPWEHEGKARLYSDRFDGFSLFVSKSNPHLKASLKCASSIGAALRQAGFKPSRYHADPVVGENRPFADEANGVHYFDNLAVLKTASIPALLFEAGVIVNRDEEIRLLEPATRKRIGESIVSAVGGCL